MCGESEEMFMRTKGFLLALALVSAGPALAQSGNSGHAVALEIVGSAGVDVKPSRVIMMLRYKGEGKTKAEAERALATKLAAIQRALKTQGIAAAAIGNPTPQESAKMLADSAEMVFTADADSSDTTEPKEPSVALPGIKKLTVATVDQADAVKAKLAELDVKVEDGSIEPDAAGIDAAQREVKALALRAARSDAEIYAKEMGMRVNRVVRISETGNGPLLPGIQAKLEQAVMQGPKALARMFKRPDGAVRIETSIVVEFELAR